MYLMVCSFLFKIFLDWEPRLTSGVEYITLLKDGLEQLCSHPYWTRVWTVQEVALSENSWIYLGQLSPMKMLDFTVMLWEVEGYMNKRSEETAQPDLEYLYPVSFKRGSPSTATSLHRTLRTGSLATDREDFGETLTHLIGKKAKDPLDIIFACRALFPESIGQIKVNYQRDLIGVLRCSQRRKDTYWLLNRCDRKWWKGFYCENVYREGGGCLLTLCAGFVIYS
jgi:hypothetical protein